jgi:hypothetical protein
MSITRVGNILALPEVLATLPSNALRVKSWDNTHSPITQQVVANTLRANGLTFERVFDASHGRRYLLFVYESMEQRRQCFDLLTRPQGTNQ